MINALAMLGIVLLGQTLVNGVTYAILIHFGSKQLRSLQPLPEQFDGEEYNRLKHLLEVLWLIFSLHLLLLFWLTHIEEMRSPFQVVKDGIPRLTVKAAVVQLTEQYNVALWIITSLLFASVIGLVHLADWILS